ncbi:Piwi-domain-containing protein [Daedalea quercina L-15889]|uniref:Piwi-domain-containing protein n=1 Tax=Daedalea quercina L-15889 TaxID=1314783 RepID=A0A165MCT1_9APHY|nr:Piwi-domain-containing protein [Daedalea quercina L-15889]
MADQQRGRGTRGRGGGGARGGGGGRGGRGSPAPGISPSVSTASSVSGFGDRGRGSGPYRGQGGLRGGGRGGDFGARGGGGGGRGRGGGPVGVFAAGTPAVVDQRLNTLDQLVTSFKGLGIRDEMPIRPGFGTLGTTQTLRANFFAVKTTKKMLYDYEVSFTPTKEAGRDRKARIFQILETHPEYLPHVGYVAHDRSQRLVSAAKLPQPFSISVQYIEEGERTPRADALTFTVTFKLVRELDMNPLNQYMGGRPDARDVDLQPVVSALNLVLQQHASATGIRVGQNRYFFRASAISQPLSLGVEAWRGFFMSVRPMYKQLMVNINVCMTAFYKPGNLAEAMLAFQQESSGGMPKAFAEKLKVSTNHLGYIRKKAIFRLSDQTARQARFDCKELGGMVTVEQYFQRKYRITLRHAHDLPVVDLGNKDRPNLVPAELCEIFPGQAYRGRLSPTETANMIRYACNPPAVNAASIRDQGFPDLGLTGQAAALNGFGISVSPEMAVVPSRVLPAPSIAYQQGRPNVRDASWNILDVKFQKGGNARSWAVMLVEDGGRGEFRGPQDPELVPFLKTFSMKCTSSGITGVGRPTNVLSTGRLPHIRQDPHRKQALELVRRTVETLLTSKPSFVLVLLSNVDNYIYPGIKRLGDVELGVHTVHMQVSKARGDPKKQDQYFSNVALKVNTKLGGTNHLLDDRSMQWLRKMKTMVVGIDVTHPGPSSTRGTPSIAAVVASYDDNFVQFPASLMPQQADWNKDAKEMVANLTAALIERLQLYQTKNKRLPERILIYRDGVSEGQYDLVLREELPLIREAFRKISPKTPYKPKLTITICGKRHHARFYATKTDDATKNGNTKPGTIQDRGVTDVYGFDWYLQAHNGLQGEVRPTHYYVVYDDFHFDADTLQQGTHAASYMYARATKAVSLVPPAYYADLACERARFYLNALLNLGDEQSSVGGSSKGRRSQDEEKERVYQDAIRMWGNGVHPNLRESMFYI